MINSIPPGLVMFLGAFLVPLFPHIYRQFYMIFLVLLSAISLFSAEGSHLIIQVQDIQFLLHHSDNLSFPFAIVFHIAAFLVIIYGSHIKDWREQLAILSYAGAAICALHAGDLFTLFLWWEATAFTSVILIFGGKTYRAYRSAIRYIVIQVGSGILLLSGAILLFQSNNEAIFKELDINSKEIAYVTQTTLSVDDTQDLIKALQEKFPTIIGPSADDICYATQNRQDAVKQLSLECEIVLVIGSKTSSNSNRLKELAEKCGTKSFLIDGKSDIDVELLRKASIVGITAGASAPEEIVQDVISFLYPLGYQSVRNLSENNETMTFKLPKELLD